MPNSGLYADCALNVVRTGDAQAVRVRGLKLRLLASFGKEADSNFRRNEVLGLELGLNVLDC